MSGVARPSLLPESSLVAPLDALVLEELLALMHGNPLALLEAIDHG